MLENSSLYFYVADNQQKTKRKEGQVSVLSLPLSLSRNYNKFKLIVFGDTKHFEVLLFPQFKVITCWMPPTKQESILKISI